MFGKGGGALSTWIKEFCELVFIQTLQAFIYAIVIAFIVEILTSTQFSNNANMMSSDDHNTAVGIICVIALVSIFKVEDLARKIFGFGPTKADHGNAVKSIAKTAFAMQIGKRVLDNGGKILGGAGAVLGAGAKKIKAKKNYQADLEAYRKDNGLDGSKGVGVISPDGGTKNRPELSDSAKSGAESMAQLKKQHMEEAKKKLEMSRNINDKNEDGTINGKMREQKIALFEQAQAERRAAAEAAEKEKQYLSGQLTDTPISSGSTKGASLPKDYHQKMRQFESNFKKEIAEIDKQKKEGIKNLTKGITESGFALIGGTAGAVLGGADGNLDEAIQGGMAGMGLGDALGGGAVDITFKVTEVGKKAYDKGRDVTKEVSQKGVKQTVNEHRNKYWDKEIKNTKKALEDSIRQIELSKNSGKTRVVDEKTVLK